MDDASYRQKQRGRELARAGKAQHPYRPSLPARSKALVNLLPNATQNLRSPAEAREHKPLTTEEVVLQIRTQLCAAAHAGSSGTGAVEYRRLYQQYAKDYLAGLTFQEWRSAVRADGKIDRSAMADRELRNLYATLVGANGRIGFNEFRRFLGTPPAARTVRARSPIHSSPGRSPRLPVPQEEVALQVRLTSLTRFLNHFSQLTSCGCSVQVELERSRDELGALEERKAQALAAEAYEEAAGLRDQIALLQEFVTEHTPVLKTEVMARGHEERAIDWAARLHGGPVPPEAMPVAVVEIIARCAEWVARYGGGFEETLRKKHRDTPGPALSLHLSPAAVNA